MLKRLIEQHELDAADRKRALDERISALPKQVLSEVPLSCECGMMS